MKRRRVTTSIHVSFYPTREERLKEEEGGKIENCGERERERERERRKRNSRRYGKVRINELYSDETRAEYLGPFVLITFLVKRTARTRRVSK